MVTKEQVENAKAEWRSAGDDFVQSGSDFRVAYFTGRAGKAFVNYVLLKEAYENGSGE